MKGIVTREQHLAFRQGFEYARRHNQTTDREFRAALFGFALAMAIACSAVLMVMGS